jgi:predicted metal-dependent hydrolase
MAYKQFVLEDIGLITVLKRKGTHNLRISITSKGNVRVTIPSWSPYHAGVAFARSRASWIIEHAPKQRPALKDGDQIGKAHRLIFVPTDATDRSKATTHIRGNEIRIRYPSSLSVSDTQVQSSAEAAAIRALKLQAQNLLPQRTATLATQYGYSYKSITIKNLKSRWGSCDQDKNIVYNLFLMQLPWQLIDYVILHELSHTKVLRHGDPFWREMEKNLPTARTLRKQVHAYQPVLHVKT